MISCEIGQIPRKRKRPFSQLVFRSNINQRGLEALNQIISERGHQPRPQIVRTQVSSQGAAALSVGQSYRNFYVRNVGARVLDSNTVTRKCRFAL
jgi:hypothetical protein